MVTKGKTDGELLQKEKQLWGWSTQKGKYTIKGVYNLEQNFCYLKLYNPSRWTHCLSLNSFGTSELLHKSVHEQPSCVHNQNIWPTPRHHLKDLIPQWASLGCGFKIFVSQHMDTHPITIRLSVLASSQRWGLWVSLWVVLYFCLLKPYESCALWVLL